MNVRIKRFEKDLPLPQYKTDGAAAFDLTARVRVEIPPRELRYVPLNVAVETPPGHFLLLVARSSTHKKGIWMANGIGVGDPDFSGNSDEYQAVYYNFTEKPVLIERGERIAQGLLVPRLKADWQEVGEMPNETRGGFGTTGNH